MKPSEGQRTVKPGWVASESGKVNSLGWVRGKLPGVRNIMGYITQSYRNLGGQLILKIAKNNEK